MTKLILDEASRFVRQKALLLVNGAMNANEIVKIWCSAGERILKNIVSIE